MKAAYFVTATLTNGVEGAPFLKHRKKTYHSSTNTIIKAATINHETVYYSNIMLEFDSWCFKIYRNSEFSVQINLICDLELQICYQNGFQ
jgi:hypothetical protein